MRKEKRKAIYYFHSKINSLRKICSIFYLVGYVLSINNRHLSKFTYNKKATIIPSWLQAQCAVLFG